jgi:hypothetical protein
VTDIVRHAKQILRDAGYVVIPRERHVVLTVNRTINADVIEMLKGSPDVASFQRYCDSSVGAEMGHMLMEKAVVKTDDGYDSFMHAYKRRYQAGIILPQ